MDSLFETIIWLALFVVAIILSPILMAVFALIIAKRGASFNADYPVFNTILQIFGFSVVSGYILCLGTLSLWLVVDIIYGTNFVISYDKLISAVYSLEKQWFIFSVALFLSMMKSYLVSVLSWAIGRIVFFGIFPLSFIFYIHSLSNSDFSLIKLRIVLDFDMSFGKYLSILENIFEKYYTFFSNISLDYNYYIDLIQSFALSRASLFSLEDWLPGLSVLLGIFALAMHFWKDEVYSDNITWFDPGDFHSCGGIVTAITAVCLVVSIMVFHNNMQTADGSLTSNIFIFLSAAVWGIATLACTNVLDIDSIG